VRRVAKEGVKKANYALGGNLKVISLAQFVVVRSEGGVVLRLAGKKPLECSELVLLVDDPPVGTGVWGGGEVSWIPRIKKRGGPDQGQGRTTIFVLFSR